jgi:hypothetical protein
MFLRPAAVLILALAASLAADPARDELFAGKVVRLDLAIPPEGLASLAQEPRKRVAGSLAEPGFGKWDDIGVRLKGNSSFRPIQDRRPGFSLRISRGDDGRTYRGMESFQLNNAAQDGTYLNELVGGMMARHAGVPASRCTLVLLSVNGDSRGVYVLKEGFDRTFLAGFHRSDEGTLFDGGLHNDIHPGLEQDLKGSGGKEALVEFAAALAEPDSARREARLGRILDIDGYLRHLAVENVLVHMDGYSYRANNYRAYHDPSTGRFGFVFHGMDNLFGFDAWGQSHVRGYVLSVPGVVPLYPSASATAVARALWSLPAESAVRGRFRREAVSTYVRFFRNADWPARAEAKAADLGRQIAALDPGEGKAFEGRAREFVRKLRARMDVVHAQFADVERLAAPGRGPVALGAYAWTCGAEGGAASEEGEAGRRELVLKVAGGKADARLPLSLEPGAYRLSASVASAGLREAAFRARLSGQDPASAPSLGVDGPARAHAAVLEVGPGDATLVLELRGQAGEARVDLGSLRLERLR